LDVKEVLGGIRAAEGEDRWRWREGGEKVAKGTKRQKTKAVPGGSRAQTKIGGIGLSSGQGSVAQTDKRHDGQEVAKSAERGSTLRPFCCRCLVNDKKKGEEEAEAHISRSSHMVWT